MKDGDGGRSLKEFVKEMRIRQNSGDRTSNSLWEKCFAVNQMAL